MKGTKIHEKNFLLFQFRFILCRSWVIRYIVLNGERLFKKFRVNLNLLEDVSNRFLIADKNNQKIP